MTRQQRPTVWIYKAPFTFLPFSSPLTFKTMPQPGQSYVTVNEQSGTALDLSRTGRVSVVGYDLHGGSNQKVKPTTRPSILCLPINPRSLRSGVFCSGTTASGRSKASAVGASLLSKGYPKTAPNSLGPGHRRSGRFELMKEIPIIIGTLTSPQVACICSLSDYSTYFPGSMPTRLVTVTPPPRNSRWTPASLECRELGLEIPTGLTE